MADTKVDALPAVVTPALADIFYVDQAGTSKQMTATQLQSLMFTAPTFAAGSASAGTWPKFTAGTVLTAAIAGTIELDANGFYITLDNSNRGVVALEYFIRANATVTYASNTAQQALFTSPTNGAITLPVGVYEFEAFFSMGSMSATNGNGVWSLIGAGTATLTQVLQFTHGVDKAIDTTSAVGGNSSASATIGVTNSTTADVSTDLILFVKGTFNVSVTGTIIPSFAQTTAAAAVLRVGSFFKCKRLGAQAAISVGNWS